jgi:hypothetical protein
MQNENLKLKINKFQIHVIASPLEVSGDKNLSPILSLRGAERRSNPKDEFFRRRRILLRRRILNYEFRINFELLKLETFQN